MNTPSALLRIAVLLAIVMGLSLPVSAAPADPFLGNWALTIPGNNAGWLGIRQSNGHLVGTMLWGWGSVEPLASVKVDGDQLIMTRLHRGEKTDANGKKVRITTTETITATLDGENMKLTTVKSRPGEAEFDKASFSGKRMPAMPPTPDLSKVKYGEPIQLFNGRNLDGWRLLDPGSVSGWSVHDGVLTNNPVQVPGKPHKNYGNLRTDREFTDFNLSAEVNVPKDGNSGIYLRGIYEVQIADTYGHPLDPHNMGAVYSRIMPLAAAEKPAGEWQTINITLVDQHVTVVLNGKTIICNEPVEGCTGGALWSDVTRPGPLYLQGDHSGVNYRNVVLKPVVE